MKNFLMFLVGFALLIAFTQCNPKITTMELSILVVTGGHEYDTAEFVAMFGAMEHLEIEYALKPEAWKLLDGGGEYDAIVFPASFFCTIALPHMMAGLNTHS